MFFFFKQKTAYEILIGLVGSEMCIRDRGFSDNIVTQIALADKHGNLLGSLTKIETYMLRMTKVRKKLMEVATYPILLLGFLILIMLGLKNYLLPQLLEGDGKDNWAVQLVQIFPQLFFVTLCGLLVLSLILYLWVKHQPALVFYRRMAKIPFIGQTVRLYTTAYYAREWGNLLGPVSYTHLTLPTKA